MKLNTTQLRKIIAEEVKKSQGRRLGESIAGPGDVIGQAASTFLDVVTDSWDANADPQGTIGDWGSQVQAARQELDERLDDILREVEDKLFGGDYI